HFGGWKAVMKICFVMGIIEVLGSAWAIHLFSQHGAEFNGWMGMADWALVFPPIMQGLSASKMFFFVLVGLSLVYMFFASRKLRAEEDAQGTVEISEEPEVIEALEQAIKASDGLRPVSILAVCGNGQGSSMMMKMKIGKYLEKKGIPHVMDSCAVSDYKSKLASTDIIVSSKHLSAEMEPGEGKFVLGVQNMLNPNSFGDELLDIINKNFVPAK
ncbi:PTS ascorbate-specific subunit IIBC, partial [Vibrio diabolicus]|nr:PTS ascorbate-specific subunit IIBC [Vibrio diabolicus]